MRKLFRQRAFKGGWILAVFWSLLSFPLAGALVESIATLLGESDMDRYAIGTKALNLAATVSVFAALVYAYFTSRQHR
jgi:hypothetical protein